MRPGHEAEAHKDYKTNICPITSKAEGGRLAPVLGTSSGIPRLCLLCLGEMMMSMTDVGLIRTGEAAQLLGCSRQHVVDLCDEGRLSVERLGRSHRYVRRSEVLALVSKSLTKEQEQSRWLHQAVVGRLVMEPDHVLSRARENLDRFSGVHKGTMAEYWLDQWRRTLDSGLDNVLTVLVSVDPQAIELRQNSPFTGILADEERAKVLASFRAHWRTAHTT
jgi:excisionase family DNA binding protein